MNKTFRLIPLLSAIAIMVLSFAATPAKAMPFVSIELEGFIIAAPEETGLSFGFLTGPDEGLEDIIGGPLSPVVTEDIADELDDAAPPIFPGVPGITGYGALLGLHYEVSFFDPSPLTEREWNLTLDLNLDGFAETSDEIVPLNEGLVEDLIGTTFPTPPLPITELTGPFSVDDLADLGGFILDILSECSPGATAINLDGAHVATCLFESAGPLSGDIFLGIGVFPTLALLEDIGPEDEELEAIFLGFDAHILLTEIPEPATLSLFGLGLAGLGVLSRRRRTRSEAV